MKKSNKIEMASAGLSARSFSCKARSMATLLLIVCSLSVLNVASQNEEKKVWIGGGIQSNCAANWHGGLYTPYVSLSRKYSSYQAGPVIQKRDTKFCGARAEFVTALSTRFLSDSMISLDYHDKDLVQINMFSYVQYISNASLSYSAVRVEERTHRDLQTNWNNLKISTAEAGLGMELQVNFSQNVSWKTRIGATFYYHTKYMKGMYHDKMAPVLNLGTAIHIDIL